LIVVAAREVEVYEHQEFNFAGPVGDYGFAEDYTSEVRGRCAGKLIEWAGASPTSPSRLCASHWDQDISRAAAALGGRALLDRWNDTPSADAQPSNQAHPK
jgi:hypothetical protein